MEHGPLHILCKFLAALAMLAGVLGMMMSFSYLASRNMEDIHAGTSGFMAGAVLIGSGLISLSMLASTENRNAEKRRHSDDDDVGIMKRDR